MSLYGKYIKERASKDIIETDISFVTYYILDKTCYLDNFYVLPEFRSQGEGTRIINELEQLAISKNCNQLVAGICPSANGSTESLKVVLAMGGQLDSASLDYILFKKKLGA